MHIQLTYLPSEKLVFEGQFFRSVFFRSHLGDAHIALTYRTQKGKVFPVRSSLNVFPSENETVDLERLLEHALNRRASLS